jgi:predicted DNA-binding transcriptional regulator AlpA
VEPEVEPKPKRKLTKEQRAKRRRTRVRHKRERAQLLASIAKDVQRISVMEAADLAGVDRSTWWRWVRAGHVPAPQQQGPKASGKRGYRLGEIVEWLRMRPRVPGAAK